MATRPPKPREKESKVQRSVVVRLRRLGIKLIRRNVGARGWTDKQGRARVVMYGAKGQADLYGWEIATGRHWEIETKAKGEKPTEHQLAWLAECTRLGVVAFWGDNVNTIERVAEAVLAGGRIVWRDGCDYDIEMPTGKE